MATPERLRSDAGRGKIATIAGVVLMLIASLIAFTPTANAATNATYNSLVYSGNVGGSFTGGSLSNQPAGLMKVTLTGGQIAYVYCIDINTSITSGNTLPEVDWAASGITNLNKITGILHSYDATVPNTGPTSYQLVGDANDRAAGIQAAIWHYSDGFVMSSPSSGNVKTNYDTIIAAVTAAATVDGNEPAPSLDITPISNTGYVGDVVGAYTISTTATTGVALNVSGASIVDNAGAPLSGPYNNGTTFYLKKNDNIPGSVTVSASVTATIHSGRVFAKFKADGSPLYQRLIMANTSQATSDATATAEWTEPPVPVGSLKVTKQVNGTVDTEGNNVLTREFTIEVKDSSDTVVATEQLKDGESFTIGGLAPGSYTVTETVTGGNGVTVTYDPSQTVTVVDKGTATVTVKNSYPEPVGGLKVTKTVVGDYDENGDPVGDRIFNVTITGPNNYSATRTVSATSPLVLNGLALGSYTVTETGNTDGATVTYVPADGVVEVTQNTQSEVAITNSYPNPDGSLRIVKSVVGKDEEGNPLDNREYEVVVTGPHGYTKTVNVSAATSVLLEGLVSGTYTVTETDPEDGSSVTYSSSGGVVLVKQTAGSEITITNTYPEPAGSLEIIKALVGTVDDQDNPIDDTTEFEVVVTGPHGYTKTVNVSAGTPVVLEGLVSGEYTVTETDPGGGATITYAPSQSVSVGQKVRVEVTITNSYPTPEGSLKVTKIVEGPSGHGPYTVHIYGPDSAEGEPVATLVLEGGESKTVDGLAPGEYVVEEESPGAGVTVSYSTEGGVVAVARNQVAEVVVTNTYPVVTTSTTVPEETTTTTEQETTTTTEPPTTTSLEEVGGIDEENATTTAPEVKDTQVTPTTVASRRLPRTGSNSTTTLSLAGVFLTAGAALVVFGRRQSMT